MHNINSSIPILAINEAPMREMKEIEKNGVMEINCFLEFRCESNTGTG